MCKTFLFKEMGRKHWLGHQILLPCYSFVWKIIQEKNAKIWKLKKSNQNSRNESIQTNLCFLSHYKHHTYRHKTTKVFYGNPIDLISESKSVFSTFLWIPLQHIGQFHCWCIKSLWDDLPIHTQFIVFKCHVVWKRMTIRRVVQDFWGSVYILEI